MVWYGMYGMEKPFPGSHGWFLHDIGMVTIPYHTIFPGKMDNFPTVRSIQHFRPPPGVDQRAAARGLHRAFAEGLLPVHHGTH